MSTSVHVGILGAGGFGAGELLRLFTQHPAARVVSLVSTSLAGRPIAAGHPHLRGFYDELTVREELDLDALLAGDWGVVIAGLPNGKSAAAIAAVLDRAQAHPRGDRLRVIDLSGDLRLRTPALHAAHYRETPAMPELRREFVYGLPELNRDAIRKARWIANPGCLAGAAILAIAPLLTPGRRGSVSIDAKTGSSGAGRELKETTHHPTRHANFFAYKPLAHQHEPEILQALGDPLGERIQMSFVAQSMDCARGIYSTAHLTLPEGIESADLRRRYAEFYAASRFVRVVDGAPALQDVVGSNFCDIGVAARGRQVVVMSALDNLVKGMAGCAIQNLNLMCGLEETSGLWAPSFRPV